MKDEIACQELPDELNVVIDLTIYTDCHMREGFMKRLQSAVPLPNPQSTSLSPQTSATYLVDPELRQVGMAHFSTLTVPSGGSLLILWSE